MWYIPYTGGGQGGLAATEQQQQQWKIPKPAGVDTHFNCFFHMFIIHCGFSLFRVLSENL